MAAERTALLARAREAYEEALALLDRGGFEQVMHAKPAQLFMKVGGGRAPGRAAGGGPRGLLHVAQRRCRRRIALAEAEALLALSRPAEALRAVEPLLGPGPEGWALAARAAEALGAKADARAFLARAAAPARACP